MGVLPIFNSEMVCMVYTKFMLWVNVTPFAKEMIL